MTENVEPMPTGPLVDKDGNMQPDWRRYFERRAVSTQTNIGGILSGFNTLQSQTTAQITAEANARIAGDNAVASSGDGTGTTDAGTYSAVATTGATWIVAKTLVVTPTGAGSYTITFLPDLYNGSITPTPTTLEAFNGNWRIIEELTGGGTEHTLDSGTFTLTYTPELELLVGEGGSETITIPAFTSIVFNGLPSGPIAANETAQVDIRLEFQRASGSNNATSLSGSITAVWA